VADFLDTNVLVYAFDSNEPVKQARALQVMSERPDAVIGTQVLLEWYSVMTRKFSPPMPTEIAVQALMTLTELDVVDADAELVVRAAQTSASNRLSIWDSMIIESACMAGCQTLLSEDLADGLVVRGVTVRNPFD